MESSSDFCGLKLILILSVLLWTHSPTIWNLDVAYSSNQTPHKVGNDAKSEEHVLRTYIPILN
uniref:Uncharacterized protein n=1 Tax=Arundo donax TaxID=35708 RepID=A0A0A8YI25_ARUDO